MHYFLEKLIMLTMTTEKHPVAMKKYVLRSKICSNERLMTINSNLMNLYKLEIPRH